MLPSSMPLSMASAASCDSLSEAQNQGTRPKDLCLPGHEVPRVDLHGAAVAHNGDTNLCRDLRWQDSPRTGSSFKFKFFPLVTLVGTLLSARKEGRSARVHFELLDSE